MNFLVNILKIIIVLALIAVAGVFIAMGAMVLFPSFSLFGIHYVSGDSQKTAYYYDITDTENGLASKWASVDTVLIETDGWNVNISTDVDYTEKGFDIWVSRSYRGFATNPVSTAEFSGYKFEERAEGTYMYVYMTEPTGLISKSDAVVDVRVGANVLAGKKLEIKTNSGIVTVGESVTDRSTTLNIKDLAINSTNGLVKIRDVNVIDNLVVEKESGEVKVSTDLTCDVNLDIKSGYGNAEFLSIGSDLSENSLVINKMFNSGIYFDDIYGDLLITADGGYVKGNKVNNSVLVNAKTCKLILNEVGGMTSFTNSEGSLEVKKALGGVTAQITNGNGSINIEELKGTTTSKLETRNGEIKVQNVYCDVNVKSVSGKINLTNATDELVNFVIESNDSEVVLNDVNGSVKFTTLNKGKARVSATYVNLLGENKFITQTGVIDVKFTNANHKFLFKEWQTANKVNIKLSNLEEYDSNNSLTDERYKSGVKIGGYTGTENNLSLISVSGAINVNYVQS